MLKDLEGRNKIEEEDIDSNLYIYYFAYSIKLNLTYLFDHLNFC
jgi:hypothetical protein